MDHEEVGRHWDENAEAWIELVRAGYDRYRDGLNTPAFLAMLPNVEGLSGLDVGCGEGNNTRLVAERGAHDGHRRSRQGTSRATKRPDRGGLSPRPGAKARLKSPYPNPAPSSAGSAERP
jgi:SAM-dependent methyltransferase